MENHILIHFGRILLPAWARYPLLWPIAPPTPSKKPLAEFSKLLLPLDANYRILFFHFFPTPSSHILLPTPTPSKNLQNSPTLAPPRSHFRSSLWFRITKNRDWGTGPLARPFARSLTHSLAPDCSLRSRPPLHSLVCSLAHFAHSLAHEKENF